MHRDEKRVRGAINARPRCFLYSRIITIIGARTCASMVLYLASEIVGTGVKGEKDEAPKSRRRKEGRTDLDGSRGGETDGGYEGKGRRRAGVNRG